MLPGFCLWWCRPFRRIFDLAISILDAQMPNLILTLILMQMQCEAACSANFISTHDKFFGESLPSIPRSLPCGPGLSPHQSRSS
jgi:hypothetical protein